MQRFTDSSFVEWIHRRFDPEICFRRGQRLFFYVDDTMLAFLVGAAAIGLPVILALSAWLTQVWFYDSISHFYYDRFLGAFFVGTLIFIGAFLMAYRGKVTIENYLARAAGLGAILVALFPTSGPGCDDCRIIGRAFVQRQFGEDGVPRLTPLAGDGLGPFQPWANTDIPHFGGAGMLFVILGIFCLFIFTRVLREDTIGETDDDRYITRGKTRRDVAYVLSGIAIFACLALIAAKKLLGFGEDWWDRNNITFWVEAIMLIAFGLSWALKGKLGGGDPHSWRRRYFFDMTPVRPARRVNC